MKLQIKKGTTSKLLQLFIQDASSTTGAGLTGLVFNSAGLTAYYYREGAASATAMTLVTMTLGTWTSLGFVVIDGTNMPGCYQLGIPDAALATGANSVLVLLKGATNMAPLVLEIELVENVVKDAFDRLGAPAGASVSADVAAVKSDTGGIKTKTDQLTFTGANKVDASLRDWLGTAPNALLTGRVDANAQVVGDKTGYALSAAGVQAIWDALTSALTTAGSIGKKLADLVLGSDNKVLISNNAHTGAVIPTVTAVTNDVGITQAGADKVWSSATRTLTAFSTALAVSVWDVLESAIATASSIGLKVKTNLDATISSRSTYTGTDTAGTTTLLSRIPGTVQPQTGDSFARLGAPAGASVSADLAAVKVETNSLDATKLTTARAAKLDGLPEGIKINTALNNFEFLMVDSTDHVTPKTGLTVTATRSIDGGAFAACANAVTEVSNGIYKINLAASDLNGTIITLRFTAAASDDRLLTLKTTP